MANGTSTSAHVVVVGGGFGGMAAIRALRGVDADVTLIDRHVYNTFQPLLYQVATANLNPGDVSYFLRAVRRRNPRVRVVNAEVVGVDAEGRTVTLAGGEQLSFDYLVIATGVAAEFFGVPGAERHAFPLYTRPQALALRDKIVSVLEASAATSRTAPGPDAGGIRIVVVGGGPTGVETAGALAEMRNVDMPVTYPELDAGRVHVTLVEMAPHVLSAFSPASRAYARRALEARGVDLRLSTSVTEVRPDGVLLGDGALLPAQVVIWASGVSAPAAVSGWGLDQGRGGRIVVDDHLRVGGSRHVFAVGDVAIGADGALAQLAQVALQGGAYAARAIAADLAGGTVGPFSYRDKGILATIGRSSAVAEVAHWPKLRGFPAWAVWTGVHVFSLLGGRNRAAAMVNLGAKYVFWRVNHNAIVGEVPPVEEG